MQVEAASSSIVQNGQLPDDQQFSKLDFMNLLIAQIKNQDPLEPLDNNEFMGQMTQFSSLEQLSNIEESISALHNTNQIISGASMIGKDVSIVDDLGEVLGSIDKIRMANDSLEVSVNGNWYDSKFIREIQDSQPISQQAAQDNLTN